MMSEYWTGMSITEDRVREIVRQEVAAMHAKLIKQFHADFLRSPQDENKVVRVNP